MRIRCMARPPPPSPPTGPIDYPPKRFPTFDGDKHDRPPFLRSTNLPTADPDDPGNRSPPRSDGISWFLASR
ncbi:hypothetical protein Q1695_005707 [Nippostrongylus brasiliensis]|nr:hypothetical protein Q1695_005707 [Nippostrongylus brasiliensis]